MAESQPGNVISPGAAQPDASWQFHADEQPQPTAAAQPTNVAGEVHWTASEFIGHSKTAGWYILLVIAALVVAGLVFLLTKDKISSVMIVIAALIFAVFAARKPRELDYQVDSHGLQIGPKAYPYGTFRSFSIVDEGAIESIWLMPLKRFMPILTIYFDPKDGPKIVNMMAQFLPVENHKLDPIDRLMQRLRF
ncbi:MAG TPA: hypothetical protein VLF90_01695 [Patescibacteria group bacterium]|nr:hypothetical protein [Patescibacteria group bacterium]